MRVLVHEYFCGGGLAGKAFDAALVPAGAGMLLGLVEDVRAAGHETVVLLDERVSLDLPGGVVAVAATDTRPPRRMLDDLLPTVDAALVVAPEHDGILPSLVERVEHAGVVNLGSPSGVIRDVSDKRALGARLHRLGIRTPACAAARGAAQALLARHGELVAKPNRGAGCIDTFVCRSAADLARLPARDDWLVQERVRGLAASVAFVLSRSGPPVPLRAGVQEVREAAARSPAGQGVRLDYHGGHLPLPADRERRAIDLGRRTLECLPGLHGFVGIDLVLGESPGSDTVVEVNARPTVAYAALRRLASFNIAGLLLGQPERIAWRDGVVEYAADGRCRLRD